MFGGMPIERYGGAPVRIAPWPGDRTRLTAIGHMLLASLCFAAIETVGGVFIRGESSVEIVWFRYATHLFIMLVVFAPRYRRGLVRSTKPSLQVVRSLTMLAMPACYLLAVHRMPSYDVWSVYWMSPLIALALSTFVLGERAGRTRWTASLVGLVGVLAILRPDAATLGPAMVLAFGMGLCISVHLMLSRVLRADSPITSLFHTALWVFIVLCFVIRTFWVVPDLSNMVGMVLIGLIGLVGLYSLARAGELAPLAVVASFAYSETLWLMFFGVLAFHIIPGRRSIAGAAVVAGTIGFLLVYEYQRAPRPA